MVTLNPPTRSEVNKVGIVNNAHALKLVQEAKINPNGGLVLTSFQLRAGQKKLLEGLANLSGESQATILRGICDEWVNYIIQEHEQK